MVIIIVMINTSFKYGLKTTYNDQANVYY